MSDDRDQRMHEQLDALWQQEVARAEGYRPQPARPRRASNVTVVAQLAAAALVIVVIVGALYVALPSGPASSPVPTSSPSPTPPPTPGALLNGIPTSFDGQPVLRGDDLRGAIAASTNDTPFLAGGYLQSRVSVFNRLNVPADESADEKAIDQCFSFGLYDQLVGGLVIWVSRGDAGLLTADMIGVDRPVVLRLHTHDSRCTQPYCVQTPVLVSVAWLGDIGTGGVSPTRIRRRRRRASRAIRRSPGQQQGRSTSPAARRSGRSWWKRKPRPSRRSGRRKSTHGSGRSSSAPPTEVRGWFCSTM